MTKWADIEKNVTNSRTQKYKIIEKIISKKKHSLVLRSYNQIFSFYVINGTVNFRSQKGLYSDL